MSDKYIYIYHTHTYTDIHTPLLDKNVAANLMATNMPCSVTDYSVSHDALLVLLLTLNIIIIRNITFKNFFNMWKSVYECICLLLYIN